MSKEELIVIRCDSEFKGLILEAARNKGLSSSSYVRMVLTEALKK